MIFKNHLKTAGRIAFNLAGWHTKRKIVVIESDDWGSIRMSSKESIQQLNESGLKFDSDPYCLFDSLEQANDLLSLFDVLTKFKDSNNNHPVFTTNNIVGNPIFENIKNTGYKKYFHESFTDTYKRRSQADNTLDVFKQGLNHKLVRPQYHGREHVNVNRWLQYLQNNNESMLKAFNFGIFSLPLKEFNPPYYNMDSCNFQTVEELEDIKNSLVEGLLLFEKTWGYKATSFIGSCYIWSSEIELVLAENEIKYLQSAYVQNSPSIGRDKFTKRYHYTGQKNKIGQTYMIRNAFFEPSLAKKTDNVVSSCINEIKFAFAARTPAIISSHRVNYMGSIVEKNRTESLESLKILLNRILEKWPDVEFMSTDQLGDLITQDNA
jgi:hypothetical protein